MDSLFRTLVELDLSRKSLTDVKGKVTNNIEEAATEKRLLQNNLLTIVYQLISADILFYQD
jgi:hypothetical protein